MANSILIEVDDEAAGAELERRLVALGIGTTRLSQSRAIQFGMKLSAGKIALEITPDEIRDMFQASPAIVRSFVETLKEFWNLIHVHVDGEPIANIPRGDLQHKSFEEFIARMRDSRQDS